MKKTACPMKESRAFAEFLLGFKGGGKDRKPARVPDVMRVPERNDVVDQDALIRLKKESLLDLDRLSSGSEGLVLRATEEMNTVAAAESLPRAAMGSDTIAPLAKAIRKDDPNQHVDLGYVLKSVGLQDLPRSCWPAGHLVDSLATEVAKLRKKKIADPSIFVDLRKYLPFWCSEQSGGGVHDEGQEDAPAFEQLALRLLQQSAPAPKSTGLLFMLLWNTVRCHAVAAAGASQWAYTSCPWPQTGLHSHSRGGAEWGCKQESQLGYYL